jgi:hypothetical protein
MIKSELSAIQEELEVMKAQARHEGYEKAIEDLQTTAEQRQKDYDRLTGARDKWTKALHQIREAWQKTTGQSNMVTLKGKPNTYRAIFGHKLEVDENRSFYINMPEDLDEFGEALFNMVQKAHDFEVLLASFETNELVKAQWERLLVAMRMTQQ